MSRRGSLWPLLVPLAVIAAAFSLAFGASRQDIELLHRVRATPRARLADHRSGPAIYSGTISGPEDRFDVGGNRAAASWWWVSERISKNHYKTVCSEQHDDRMRFVDHDATPLVRRPDDSAPLTMFDTAKDISLLGPDRRDAWNEPLQIDLADQAVYWPSEWPPDVAARCRDEKRTFSTQSIPEGARADVLACNVDGKLVAGASDPAAVISLGDIDAYLSRRAYATAVPFFFAAGVAWVLLLAITFGAYRFRRRTVDAVVPRSPR